MNPIVSVVICTYNRAPLLEKCLTCLQQQTEVKPKDFEVVIIDNNSLDHTAELCAKMLEQDRSSNFHYFLEKNQGHSYARNRGILESKGRLIAYLDDDAFVRKEYIKEVIDFFDMYPNAMVTGGKIIPVYEKSEPKWMSNYLLPLVAALDMGKKPRLFSGRKFPIGANIIFRKVVFETYGLFNVELGRIGNGLMGGDEKDLAYRLKEAKEEIWYAPKVVVDHYIPEKRLGNDYIKGLAIGVGRSEKIRLKNRGFIQKMNRGVEEIMKIGGTMVLFLFHAIRGRFQSALMLIRFRIWVIKGFIS